MKNLIKLTLLLSFLISHSQESLVFEKIELSEKARLIGMYPHYDKEKTYENYNFIIEDENVIDSIAKTVVKGKEVINQSTRQEVNIYLYDSGKKIKTWSFDPKYNYIRIDGKSYKFNADQILSLVKKYGFRYNLKKQFYQSQEQFNQDYSKIMSDPNLLFVYKPNFKFEGTFEVSYRKSKKLKHPKAISEYLNQEIEGFREKNNYRVYYVANAFNIKNRNQYTMTIESDFELYEWFKDKKGEKKEWKPKEYSAYIFRKN